MLAVLSTASTGTRMTIKVIRCREPKHVSIPGDMRLPEFPSFEKLRSQGLHLKDSSGTPSAAIRMQGHFKVVRPLNHTLGTMLSGHDLNVIANGVEAPMTRNILFDTWNCAAPPSTLDSRIQ